MSLPTMAEILTQTNESRRLLEDSLGQSADNQISATAPEVDTAETETGGEEGQGSPSSRFTEVELAELEALAQAGNVTAIQLLDKVEEEGSKGATDAGQRSPARRATSVAEQFEEAVLRGGRGRHSAPRNLREARRRRETGVTAFQ